MKSYPSKRIRTVLKSLGLTKLKGKAEGHHEHWGNEAGRTCRPRTEESEISIAYLYPMGDELAAHGICSRQDFIKATLGSVRARSLLQKSLFTGHLLENTL